LPRQGISIAIEDIFYKKEILLPATHQEHAQKQWHRFGCG
jgi:hypothetical protein